MNPPRPEEYLPAAIQKAVINIGAKHPLSVYPMALSVGSGVVGWLFQISPLYLVALGLALLGPVWAVSQIYFRNESLGSRYLKALNRRQQDYEVYLKAHLAEELQSCCRIDGLEEFAAQGMNQLENVQIKLVNVMELLEMKLNTAEITYGRFLGAAEQVALSVLDNIKQAAGILKSAASIQPGNIRKRLETISRKPEPGREEADQAEALKKRLALYHEQLAKVKRLFAANEVAMTEMEEISAAIAEWPTDDRFARTDFEAALSRLQDLASRAHEYGAL